MRYAPWGNSGPCSTKGLSRREIDRGRTPPVESKVAESNMVERQHWGLPRIRILQIEDSQLDAELVLSELDADAIEYDVKLVDAEREYLEALEEFRPHIVLSDLS